MSATAVDLYAEAFLARCDAMRGRGTARVDRGGLHGLVGAAEEPSVRLLVTSDESEDLLGALLHDARAGTIHVFETASRCVELVAARLGWASDTVTAMVSRDITAVPALPLPSELTLRPVQLGGDDPGGVTLEDAAAAAISAATIEDPAEAFADFLRSLRPTFRLFAAIDDDGKVRATSGCGVFGGHATVIFVNTDRGWRRRGIGQAMTAHALGAAQQSGATTVCLAASVAGRSIYRRLGFETAGTLTRYRSTTGPPVDRRTAATAA